MALVMVIYHSQEYGNTRRMAEAVAKGAAAAGAGVTLVNTHEKRVDIETYRQAGAVAVGSPDYYSYIAGGLKMFFDDWYIAKGKDDAGLEEKPVGAFFSHGGGGKVRKPLETLARMLGTPVGETVESSGAPDNKVLAVCEALGKALAGAAR
ncbi:MAG: flavodoxin domain-containing protein [Planctomycetota bacterium]